MRTRTLVAAGLIALSGLLAASCGSDDDEPVVGSSDTEAVEDHNEADVTFAQGMIPHHRQAVEMADLADGRAEDPRVTDLASRIKAAQDPEIQEMTGWLEAWDEEVPAEGEHGEGHESETEMPGAMSAEDMDALEAASGGEFDEMFLTMMIEHHRGAVEMATTEVEEGSFPDAIALAEKIIDDQEAEISEMEALLAEGAPTSSSMAGMG